jgi:heme/copper-type cytochrome/quinol oxidase subunit 2
MPYVERLSLLTYIILFVIYLILHFAIGWYKNKLDNNEDMSAEGIKEQKIVDQLFKWFPAIYVVILLLYFYSL